MSIMSSGQSKTVLVKPNNVRYLEGKKSNEKIHHFCAVMVSQKISRVYLRNGFVLFIRIKTKCMCTKKVPARAVRFPTMSINHVSLFNQQRIFVTEKLLIQTALEQANPIKKNNLHMYNSPASPALAIVPSIA